MPENNKTKQDTNKKPKHTNQQAPNNSTTAREIRKTKWDKVKQNAPLSAPHRFSSTM